MPIDYAEAQRMTTRHKSALTRARKSGDPRKVVAACDAFFEDFDDHGWSYPDAWHIWLNARNDAVYAIRRHGEPLESCGSCGADIGMSTEYPWHYDNEDCRALREPIKEQHR